MIASSADLLAVINSYKNWGISTYAAAGLIFRPLDPILFY